ncbi:hypothetical protein [Fimbriiglobus ruber]|uniref:Uncharacterized protein n=1 Tax=Fimbriiglobus ruber TaxID=1908690 RepID=A0A225DG31_9BACT|nr:hypothetical protein [Fimbriiglobus ruber]OWK37468.1 hypothetical protein FRUB_06588 [Fimbriiglobus ruber]
MPALAKQEAAETLAQVVERAKPSDLAEIYAELFPEQSVSSPPTASEIARYVRSGLAAEEIVDLWNVVFPSDRNVWYDEEAKAIHYNEEPVGYAAE